MSFRHYDREEETLIAYFKQMLDETAALDEEEPVIPEVQSAPTPRVSTQEQAASVAPAAPPQSEPQRPAAVTTQEAVAEQTPALEESGPQEIPVDSLSVKDLSARGPEGETESVAKSAVTQDAASAAAQDAATSELAAAGEIEVERGTEIGVAAEVETSPESVPVEDGPKTAASDTQEPALDLPVEDNWQEDAEGDYSEPAEPYYAQDGDPRTAQDYEPLTPQLQVQTASVTEQRPYQEGSSLQSLLESVQPHTATVEEPQTATVTQTAEETEVQTAEAEPVVEQEVQSEVTQTAQIEVQEQAPAKDAAFEWENIETQEDFQALFFLVKGVRFAVPLVDLGGIFEMEKLTPLFGKPHWYKGMADIRGRKINVVDTLSWVKPGFTDGGDYRYMILLGTSMWAVGCDVLEGNKILNRDHVKWRQSAGNRPWLAGIVKEEMCALLHVDALISMFEKGFDLKTLPQ
ncbi:MAG: chemotaxis protein CheW [Succinivibrio sp.]|nr:chemotaxis protein CheW [Succinivibrio sp.]